jgi:hypothetical protein
VNLTAASVAFFGLAQRMMDSQPRPLIARSTGVRAQSLLLSSGSLVFVTQPSALFAGSGSLSMSESVDVAILYGEPMTEN